MEYKKVIETLRIMASKSKVANDVFHDFAARERARNQITIDTLFYRMKAGGFKYSKEECREVLKGLGALGIGTLKTNNVGKVISLVNIKHTLQSVGKAAISENSDTKLESYTQRNRYSDLPAAKDLPPNTHAVLGTLIGASKLVEAILKSKDVPTDKKIDAVLALIAPEKNA